MSFSELYSVVATSSKVAISVNLILREVSRLSREDNIEFVKHTFNEEVILGAIVRGGTLPSPYATDPDPLYCDIYYGEGLNECWRRFVCCKELMHLFDGPSELSNDKRKFKRHVTELLSQPTPGQGQSPQVTAEHRAYYRAAAALCPVQIRDIFRPRYLNGSMTNWDVANKFRIPEPIVPLVMSEQFTDYVEIIMD